MMGSPACVTTNTVLTKQGQQGLEGKVHGAAVGLLARLENHLLLAYLTQVEP